LSADRIIEWESEILATIVMGKVAPKRDSRRRRSEIITAETPFYGESGGQIGDMHAGDGAAGDVVAILDAQNRNLA